MALQGGQKKTPACYAVRPRRLGGRGSRLRAALRRQGFILALFQISTGTGCFS